MSGFWGDLWKVLKTGGIALDKEEAAAFGAPKGETISLWAAMSAKHGSLLAHVVCAGLWVVQFRHCEDQLLGVPMGEGNYLRAMVGLVLLFPVAAGAWVVDWIWRKVGALG